MVSTARTVVRGFLLLGGLALAGVGAVEGSTVDVVVGGVAAVLGFVGLWLQYRDRQADSDRSGDDE